MILMIFFSPGFFFNATNRLVPFILPTDNTSDDFERPPKNAMQSPVFLDGGLLKRFCMLMDAERPASGNCSSRQEVPNTVMAANSDTENEFAFVVGIITIVLLGLWLLRQIFVRYKKRNKVQNRTRLAKPFSLCFFSRNRIARALRVLWDNGDDGDDGDEGLQRVPENSQTNPPNTCPPSNTAQTTQRPLSQSTSSIPSLRTERTFTRCIVHQSSTDASCDPAFDGPPGKRPR